MPTALPAAEHAVYQLAPDLLLVFKPRGHREAEHAHPHRQRLRILRGKLRIQSAGGESLVDPDTGAVSLEAGERHSTEALDDTWLVAEG